VATGTVAHNVCSETFVSGLDPDAAYTEGAAAMPGIGALRWGMRYDVDRVNRTVQASFVGAFRSRAVYRRPTGCVLVFDQQLLAQARQASAPSATESTDTVQPEVAESPARPVEPTNPQLRAALDRAFAESPRPPYSATKAVLVVHDGKIVAERYAPGYTSATPILGYSMAKSVTNALVGILVREGRLDPKARAPIAAWRGADDPRRDITLEQLMRMTSGLDLDETGSGFDPSNRMFYDEPDMAAFAERASVLARPGQRWAYSSASTHLLARIVRDAVGGTGEAVQRFATNELFAPIGMRHVTMEMDETGTPVGAHYVLATARDWARFGELYLNDGVLDGHRILPAGWVRFSTTPTLDTTYGAGWWTNHRAPGAGDAREPGAKTGMPLMTHAPSDMFYALGNLGQFVAVLPTQHLVIVRLGRSHRPHFGAAEFERLVADCVSAIGNEGEKAALAR
jgi:CubicO group peptidase (beta-lactamase class C family)